MIKRDTKGLYKETDSLIYVITRDIKYRTRAQNVKIFTPDHKNKTINILCKYYSSKKHKTRH